jgi:hypothetical protein
LKELRLGNLVIPDVAVIVVKLCAIRAAAEFFAQVHILDASLRQGRFQGLAIELGRVSGIRIGAHLGYHFNRVAAKQLQEMRPGVVGVSN